MRITTLNLQEFHNWETRQPAIINYLQTQSPDIIVFQEVVFLPDTSPYNQVQLLNRTLAYPSEHSVISRLQPSTVHETYREGLATLSKYPVVKTDTVILKQEAGDEHNRIIQLLDFEVDGSIVKIANVHFSITDITDFATAHLLETLEILAMRGEERIIIGDFNLSNVNDTKDAWGEKYRCSNEVDYISYPSMNKSTDYVLIPKSYVFTNIEVSQDGLSDHRALAVNIK
jgi:endonuclease/exonuclease/phosphatase family metal-dependent hydrolase